jgi:hypothetical protein
MFAFGRPGRIEELLHGAGFADVRVEALDLTQAYESFDAWLESTLDLAKPLADLFGAMEPEQRAAALAEIREAFAPFATPEAGLAFPARALVAAAGA